MAAYDNVAMPGAPAAPSYAAPLLDFSPIGNLADDYYKGQENQRKLALQNAFKDGLPTDQQGNVDYRAMADTLARKGGVDQAISVANTGAQLKVGADLSNVMTGNMPQQQPRQTAPVFAPPPEKTGQPKLSSTGTDNEGEPTVRSTATELFGGRDVSQLIPRFAKALGVDPDAGLSVDQLGKVKALMTRTAQAEQPAQQPAAQQPAQDQSSGQGNLGGLVPSSFLARGGTVSGYRDILASYATSPMVSASGRAVALERMKAIDAALGKSAEQTPEQKNAAASGVTNPVELKRVEEQNKNEVDRFGKKYDAISKAGAESELEIPKLQVAQQIMSDPGFYSGPAERFSLGYKRILASIDPSKQDAAQPQEVFRKVISDSIRSQIQSFAQSGVGRVMLAEVKIMEKSAANSENTPFSNRTLVETSLRAHRVMTGLDDLAQKYKGGRLDPGFDIAARQYLKANPMFTPAEAKNPKLLGAPVTPGNVSTPQQAAQWAKQMGLQKGDPIRLSDGSYRYVP